MHKKLHGQMLQIIWSDFKRWSSSVDYFECMQPANTYSGVPPLCLSCHCKYVLWILAWKVNYEVLHIKIQF